MTTIPPPKFADLMKRYHGEIARNLDAAKMKCPGPGEGCVICAFVSCDEDTHCALPELEKHLGDSVPYCSPCERTMPECGACKGPAPHPHWCDTCGQPHDDHLCEANGRKVRLAESDKEMLAAVGCGSWKGPVCVSDTAHKISGVSQSQENDTQEIGQCDQAIVSGDTVLCRFSGLCRFKEGRVSTSSSPYLNGLPGVYAVCKREDAALAACERYQQEVSRR